MRDDQLNNGDIPWIIPHSLERSYSKQNGFSGDNMNSLNHYAYGAIGQWMHERVAGLSPDPAHPGYKHFFVRPLVLEQLDWARVELQTGFGMASSGWAKENGKVVMEIRVLPTPLRPSSSRAIANRKPSRREPTAMNWNLSLTDI